MTTEVIITGTGMPPPEAGRAGPGVLVSYGGVRLQFDAGRATSLRLAEVGVRAAELDAVFITHHHSDHLTGADDLFFAAWLNRPESHILTFVAPQGPSTRFLDRMIEPYTDDIEVRVAHTGRAYPKPKVIGFESTESPVEVWQSDCGSVTVKAVAVHHHPVDPAVAYRVDTPDGAVVISGDTRVCDEVLDLSRGCEILVHEAFRVDAWVEHTGDPSAAVIGDYHANTVALGAMANQADPGLLMLTHLAPPPKTEAEKKAFVDDLRQGGFDGEVIVCDDLASASF